MRAGVPLFKKLKTVFDGTPALVSAFPGGWVATTRLRKPELFPALAIGIVGEDREIVTNKGGYYVFNFEIGILSQSFAEAGDEVLTELVETTTIGVTASGPVVLVADKLRLISIDRFPTGARYEEDDTLNLHACYTIFRARVAM